LALPIRLHYTKPEMLRSQFVALEEPVDAWVVDVTNPSEKIVEYILGLLEREKKE